MGHLTKEQFLVVLVIDSVFSANARKSTQTVKLPQIHATLKNDHKRHQTTTKKRRTNKTTKTSQKQNNHIFGSFQDPIQSLFLRTAFTNHHPLGPGNIPNGYPKLASLRSAIHMDRSRILPRELSAPQAWLRESFQHPGEGLPEPLACDAR